MKKALKILGVTLSATLSILSFSLLSHGADTVLQKPEVISSNISYEGDFSILLAIDADTVSGGSVTVEFKSESGKSYSYTTRETTSITPHGAKEAIRCYVVASPGIAAADMGEAYTYTVTDSTGAVSDEGRISVAEYFYKRLFVNGIINAKQGTEDFDRRDFYIYTLGYGAKAQNLLYNYNNDPNDDVDVFVTDLIYANVAGYSFAGHETELLENGTTKITLPGTGMYHITKYKKSTFEKSESTAWGGSEITLDAHTVAVASGSGKYYNDPAVSGTRIDGIDLVNKLDANPDVHYSGAGTVSVDGDGKLVFSYVNGYSAMSWKHNAAQGELTSPSMIFEADASFVMDGTSQVGSIRLIGNGKELELNIQFSGDTVYISANKAFGVQLKKGEINNLRFEVDYNNAAICYYVNGKLSASETNITLKDTTTSPRAIFAFTSNARGGVMTFDNVYIGIVEATSQEAIVNSRWSELENEINAEGFDGAKTVSALKELYSLYSSDMVEWFGNLYDPSIGGFYYSNSAKASEGYLPDIESTMQILNFIRYSGMIGHPKALPESFKNSVVAFVNGLQSSSDGYFYHPQWNELELTDERRGRDQMWALQILNMFGAKPNYTTGGVEGTYGAPGVSSASHLTAPFSANSQAEIGRVAACAASLDHLASEDNFRAYLDSQDWDDAYTTGNRLAAQVVSIKDAGLLNFCIEYLNGKQKDNGMWDDQEGYKALNGFLKIAAIYESAGVVIPNSEGAAEYCIETLKTNIPENEVENSTVCWIYNVWYALDIIISRLEASGTPDNIALVNDIRSTLRTNAAEYINIAAEEYKRFIKEDGTFSFHPDKSASTSQGMPIAVPDTDEGDVNATYISSIGLTNYIFRALGYENVEIFTYHDYNNFMKIVNP